MGTAYLRLGRGEIAGEGMTLDIPASGELTLFGCPLLIPGQTRGLSIREVMKTVSVCRSGAVDLLRLFRCDEAASPGQTLPIC